MARHKGKQFWSVHVVEAGRSTTSKAAYCRRQGLDYKTFLRWSRRLDEAGRAKSAQAIVPLVVRDGAPSPGALTLRLGPDVVLSIPSSVDSRWLATLLRSIAAC